NLDWRASDETDVLTPELAEAMKQESRLLAREAYLQQRSFAGLFLANYTYVNQTLAETYEGELPGELELSDEFVRVELPNRPGLFTKSAWLAATAGSQRSFAPARGYNFVRDVLCFAPGSPDPNAIAG